MFINREKLKVLAFGSPLMLRRFIAQVDPYEVTVVGCSEAAEAADKLYGGNFDMVIVDHFNQDAGLVCREAVNNTQAPVVAVMQEKFADWNALRKLDVDGYIPDDTGTEEIMARIRAYSRRNVAEQRI
jgi:DNA-binding NarL/FixJ family response regulator